MRSIFVLSAWVPTVLTIPYYHIDAFTNELFRGNPAGVCLLADWLPARLMQNIAAEHNLAETAFVVQRGTHVDLRWFTPTVEVDLCGHATIAPAHVLFEHLAYAGERIPFHTRSGVLTVTRADGYLTLDFPSLRAVPCEPPNALVQGLGITPLYAALATDYLAVLESAEQVAELEIDQSALMQCQSRGVIVTARDINGKFGGDVDFVSRFFAPRVGVPEDPVTGSAHSTLIPYWSQQLGKKTMRALQISQRGGELLCEDRGDRVGISGRAVTYSTGYLHVPN